MISFMSHSLAQIKYHAAQGFVRKDLDILIIWQVVSYRSDILTKIKQPYVVDSFTASIRNGADIYKFGDHFLIVSAAKMKQPMTCSIDTPRKSKQRNGHCKTLPNKTSVMCVHTRDKSSESALFITIKAVS